MPRLRIDGRDVEVPAGSTVLTAARAAGIAIPTMCFLEGLEPEASCMICSVRDAASGRTLPACSARAAEGMDLVTDDAGLQAFRRTAVELLLVEHVGDCEGPCRGACPAHMDIALMIRQIWAGQLDEAAATVRRDVPFPAILGRICEAPCEKACRRALHDSPVSICLLKRYLADRQLAAGESPLPERASPTGRKVAVIGAGPAGLGAAWFLLLNGYACAIFDDRAEPGGGLRWDVDEERLPAGPRDAEIGAVMRLGAELHSDVRVGRDISLEQLRADFDAVIIAAGDRGAKGAAGVDPDFGIELSGRGLKVDSATLASATPGVFAAGGAVRPGRSAVRALAAGRRAAGSVDAFLQGREPEAPSRGFNSRMGKLLDGEMEEFLSGADRAPRREPSGGGAAGFSDAEALGEAGRCLGCDCLAKKDCRLRDCATAAGLKSGSRDAQSSVQFARDSRHPQIVWEPGKCIRCGLCVRVAQRAGEKLGVELLGRGFSVRLGVPFGETLAAALAVSGEECAQACPTGALAPRFGPS